MVGGVPPDEFQPNMGEFVVKTLDRIREVQLRVAHQLKANIQSMDKRLGDQLKPLEWDVGERVLYRYYSETGQSLSP